MNFRIVFGSVLILLGACVFLNEGESFGAGSIFTLFWPSIFVIPTGLFFHWLYFTMLQRRAAGVLIPGGILITAGLVCQAAMLLDGWSYLWPGFILAPAIGLFEFYWFGFRSKWMLIPINILVVLSLLFFAVFTVGTVFTQLTSQPMIAVLMIAVGAIVLLSHKKEA